MGEITTTQTNN